MLTVATTRQGVEGANVDGSATAPARQWKQGVTCHLFVSVSLTQHTSSGQYSQHKGQELRQEV